MLHIRRAMHFQTVYASAEFWHWFQPIILPQPPLKPQVHYLRQQTIIIHSYNWQIPATKTIPQRRVTETPITTMAADVTQLTHALNSPKMFTSFVISFVSPAHRLSQPQTHKAHVTDCERGQSLRKEGPCAIKQKKDKKEKKKTT